VIIFIGLCIYRTMQTAVGVFGNEYKQSSMTSSPPILALEVARDRNVCLIYIRRNVSYIHHRRSNNFMLTIYRYVYVHAGSPSS